MTVTPAKSHPLTRGLTLLLAVAAGVSVSNIYYNQSLLQAMAEGFHASSSDVGWIAVATQLGYASGLLLLVPLGDSLDRRKLIVGTAAGAALFLVALALAPSLGFAIVVSYCLGLICITPQLVVPYAAGLAEPSMRGRVIGTVMGGLLIGVLFSRSVAGFAGAWLGWRAVFWLGAGLTATLAAVLSTLPATPRPARTFSYRELLGSLGPLLVREPVLRRHALIGALVFGAFSAFWTTIAFYLAARPEHYGTRTVGLFALVAIAGALAAPVAGRLSDRHSPRVVNGIAIAVMVVSFVTMGLAGNSMLLLLVAVFFMDAGVQGNQISNQTRIYALAPELRNRITSVYMVCYFLGGALGSAIGLRAWSHWGWNGVWGAGAVMAALATLPLFAGGTVKRLRTSAA